LTFKKIAQRIRVPAGFVLAPLLFAYDLRIGPGVVLAPLGVAALTVLGLALGVLLAPVGMLYEDIGRAIAVVTGLWFFLTPVVYRPPDRGILRLNPVTPVLDTTRAWLTSSAPAAADGFLLVSATATAFLIVAWVLLRLARPHLVERLG